MNQRWTRLYEPKNSINRDQKAQHYLHHCKAYKKNNKECFEALAKIDHHKDSKKSLKV